METFKTLLSVLFIIVIGIAFVISFAQSYNPRRKKIKYRNTANVRGSNNVCIQQHSNLELEVLDDKHILVNGEEIYVPRHVRSGIDNFRIEQDYNDIYVNGYRYDFITKEFEDGE